MRANGAVDLTSKWAPIALVVVRIAIRHRRRGGATCVALSALPKVSSPGAFRFRANSAASSRPITAANSGEDRASPATRRDEPAPRDRGLERRMRDREIGDATEHLDEVVTIVDHIENVTQMFDRTMRRPSRSSARRVEAADRRDSSALSCFQWVHMPMRSAASTPASSRRPSPDRARSSISI